MNEHEKIALLSELERASARSERRGRFLGWGAVGGAAVALLALLAIGGARLADLRTSIVESKADLNKVQGNLAQAQEDLARVQKDVDAAEGLLAKRLELIGSIDKQAVEEAFARQARANPSTAAPPRVYVHIAREADRGLARRIAKQVEAAGFSVLGIEYVPSSASLANTEVRYYKQADSEGATRLQQVLQGAGARDARKAYLQRYERDSKTRSNQYEVWIKPQAEMPRTRTPPRG